MISWEGEPRRNFLVHGLILVLACGASEALAQDSAGRFDEVIWNMGGGVKFSEGGLQGEFVTSFGKMVLENKKYKQ